MNFKITIYYLFVLYYVILYSFSFVFEYSLYIHVRRRLKWDFTGGQAVRSGVAKMCISVCAKKSEVVAYCFVLGYPVDFRFIVHKSQVSCDELLL